MFMKYRVKNLCQLVKLKYLQEFDYQHLNGKIVQMVNKENYTSNIEDFEQFFQEIKAKQKQCNEMCDENIAFDDQNEDSDYVTLFDEEQRSNMYQYKPIQNLYDLQCKMDQKELFYSKKYLRKTKANIIKSKQYIMKNEVDSLSQKQIFNFEHFANNTVQLFGLLSDQEYNQ
ncbi:Hypothetical_protein [Hexamita inflata]|uniref:Hypothetical_protein n=1 Tax=Hexamita inflata TaxID=28002 RepID=A0AA86UF39_9EUKA|nr:Hypothetical protein HINF_LOCUS26058 [Hexamita inflata]